MRWFVVKVDCDTNEFGEGPTHYAISEYEDDECDAIAWMGEGNERFASLVADAPEMLKLLQDLWEHGMPYNNGDACDAMAMWNRVLVWNQVFAMLKKHKEHLS